MTDEEYNERVGQIEALAARYPSTELTAQNIKGYVWSLGDLSTDVLKAAIMRCVETAKFFPTIAEIRENASAISTNGKDGKHPDDCACFGTGMIIPERVNGYSAGARRCDYVPDPDDVSML